MAERDIRTTLVHAGRGPQYRANTVSPPVHRASTFVFDSLAEMEAASKIPYRGVFYGRNGTPTSVAFEDAVAELYHAHGAVAAASGVAAIMGVLVGLLNTAWPFASKMGRPASRNTYSILTLSMFGTKPYMPVLSLICFAAAISV